MKIIFVCTGNTCRSPMAEFLLKKLAAENNLSDLKISSAGIYPAENLEFPKEAKEALEAEGVQAPFHKAKGLNQELVSSAQLILAMEKRHVDWVQKRFAEAAKKTYLLNQFTGLGETDIQDPYGQPLDTYKKILSEIKAALIRLLDQKFLPLSNKGEARRGDK